ncbi:glutathione-regulated potassium-efflux system protein KefC [Massilia dura]|uniref:Glutathione-regulated potassium-efflux system protein KefC n=1 Tax=Pseudoduganella dura TaxID=321982 RepID=A0A6I3XEV6_9BURK|nr:glutathione-regulated potassium-efflux system protein KefC [Pseudoduganella dura]MUI12813.1 glutathione-regulated potassium-efflux system protein KefC [Pseudoduganella dura]GGX93052.1 glutathione-regulated potassium-efflux system protein KefC [Pseudoduganella dura]
MHDLLLTPIVFLVTAVLLVPLAQRLGLGSVLGYLIGGAIIGPWGLGLIHEVELIGHVAEIGVVLMLFLIGLELQPAKLMEMRQLVLGGGALQMATGGIALGAAAWLLGMPWVGALVAGIALALSSTAIAVQNMNERHLDNTPAGKAAFAILLFQDMAAIPLLVAVPLLGGSGAADFNWLFAIGAVICVLVVGRYAMRPALRLIARTGLREIFTAFALLLVLGIAHLMELADLSMGLGAFLAGVLLAGSEYRKALETDLEPFKGLLLGLFFTSVGMSVNFGLLAEAPARIAALAGGYVVLKMVLLGLAARALPVPAVQRWPFAALLAQGSEFAFVVLAVAHDANVVAGPWHETLVLVVAVSMALTPLAMAAADRLSRRIDRREPKPADTIEPDGARVIIAGFGRVGQIAGRMLAASGIRMTVLDNDPDLIDMLRRFGLHVFYGDATRLDLLRAAEADKAVLLINAIDDMDTSLRLADLVREHFPHIKMIGRARNVTHLFELRERGVDMVERETFESALLIGERALRQLGIDDASAQLARSSFRAHNLATLDAMFPHFRDESQMISIQEEARQELAQSFEHDRINLRPQGKPAAKGAAGAGLP